MTKLKITEAQIQKAFFEYLAIKYPKIRAVSFAIPNGGYRNSREARNLKLQGVTPGVPDIFIGHPHANYHGIFIELKSKTGVVRPAQRAMITQLKDKGYLVIVAYSLDELIAEIGEII